MSPPSVRWTRTTRPSSACLDQQIAHGFRAAAVGRPPGVLAGADSVDSYHVSRPGHRFAELLPPSQKQSSAAGHWRGPDRADISAFKLLTGALLDATLTEKT